MAEARTRGDTWPRKNTPDQIAARRERLRDRPDWTAADEVVFADPVPAETLGAFQEQITAAMVLPVGVVGPILASLGRYRLDPDTGALAELGREQAEIYVPLAHTEGGLTASLQRGTVAVQAAGGLRTLVLGDRLTRDSCFWFATSAEAAACAEWLRANAGAMAAWLRDPTNPFAKEGAGPVSASRHALLHEVDTHVVGPMCHALYRFSTGDACGPNLSTRNAYLLNHHFVLERLPAETGLRPERLFLEANMGGDKKPSHHYYEQGGHGKTVIAEATLPETVLRRYLRTSAADLEALAHAGNHGSHASGMQSLGFTPASAVAALFAATGQDLGMVGTSSMAHAVLTRQDEAVHCSLRLPNLEVATVGGGTTLPHARAFLRLMGCAGPGSVYRLAQIVAAATLCLEISAAASMASRGSADFTGAHSRFGGRRETTRE